MANKDKLYVNRHRTLKEHRAAVAARKKREAQGTPPPNAYAGNGAPGAQTRTPPSRTAPTRTTPPSRTSPPSTSSSSSSSSTSSPPTRRDPTANTGSGRDGNFGSGTSGRGRPSDPSPSPRPTQRSSTPSSSSKPPKKGDTKTVNGKKVKWNGRRWVPVASKPPGQAVRDVVSAVDRGLKLTYKKGDKKKVGEITYIHNGKGWVRYTV